jgi:hypothetical protein
MVRSSSVSRPVVIAALVGLLVVLLFTGSLLLGGGGAVGDGGWRDRLSGLRGGAPLTTTDLSVSGGSCQIDGVDIVLTRQCTLAVRNDAGLLAFGSATMRGTLSIAAGAVTVTVTAENSTVTRSMATGDSVEVVFGRSGGTLDLTCGTAGTCRVTISGG